MMKNRGIMRIAAVLVIAGAIVAGSGGVAAAAPNIEPIAAGRCEFRFHLGAAYLKDGAMIGGGYVDCKVPGPPDAFSVALRLRYKGGAGWVTRSLEASERVPAPVLNLATWAPCERGGWVVAVEMWETRGSTTAHYVDESAATITGC